MVPEVLLGRRGREKMAEGGVSGPLEAVARRVPEADCEAKRQTEQLESLGPLSPKSGELLGRRWLLKGRRG